MKTIGFTNKFDSKIVNSNFLGLENNLITKVLVKESMVPMVSQYVKNGVRIFSITLNLFDGKHDVGPYSIMTDGIWVWPSHLLYFVQKSNSISLDRDFLIHIKENNFTIPDLTKDTIRTATIFLEQSLLKLSR
jgi:hypothetical protein